MRSAMNLLGGIFRAVPADTPDVVIDRQLRELKQLLPRAVAGILVSSGFIGYTFLDEAAPLILGGGALYISFLLVHLPKLLSMNIDALPPAEKRKRLNAMMPAVIGLSLACSATAITLTRITGLSGCILIALWCAFCGLASAVSLSATPRAATTAMFLCLTPISIKMLSTGVPLLITIAVVFLCIIVLSHFQFAHIGNLLAKLSIREREIEENAARTEKKLEAFLGAASDWAWERDATGKLIYLSPSFEAITGYSIDDILQRGGDTLLELSADDQTETIKIIRDAFINPRPIHDLRYTIIKPDGKSLTLSGSRMPRYGDEGEFIGYVGWTKDITKQVEAERKLLESEQRYRDFVESAGDWAWEVNADLHYTFIAGRATELTGVDHEQFIGKKMTLSGDGADDDSWAALRQTIAARRPFIGFVSKIEIPDSESFWMERSAKPIFDEKGSFKGYRGIASDITDRIEAQFMAIEASEELAATNAKLEELVQERTASLETKSKMMAEVLESVAQGIVVLDENLVIEDLNDKAWRTSGLPEEIWSPGNSIKPVLEIGIRHKLYEYDTADEYLENIRKTLPEGSEFRAVRRQTDGKIIEEIARTRPSGGYVVSYTDITEAQSREDELRQLSKELMTAKDAAEAASRAKSEFLANMSHEIRTPMNGVIGMASLLLNTELSKKQANLARVIVSSGDNLLKIINDVLDFSRLEAGKLRLVEEPFDLRSSIDDVASLLAFSVEEKKLELMVRYQPSLDGNLIGDPGRIRQVITNLVGNAVKFTERGYVLIEVSGARRGEIADITIAITDTGCGIPADKLPSIFEEFEQVDGSSARRHDGAGLGLAISKRMVEAMGGEISVESEIGVGSTFRIRLPLAVNEEETNWPATAKGTFENLRAIIVDDISVNQTILQEQLASWGLTSDVCSDADECFAAMKSAATANEPYAVAILDFQMPGADGVQLARMIRAEQTLSTTPMILLTSAGRKGDPSGLVGDLFSAYLVKPARPAMLLDAVLTALNDGSVAQLRMKTANGMAKKNDAGQHPFTVDGTPLRILVAEDNIVNQMVIKSMLEKLDCDVTVAANGKIAVEKYYEDGADIILMDISMPEMDGMEATALIRKHQEANGGAAPIIGVTAHALREDRQRCLDAGMDDYLPKPVKQDALTAMLAKWMPADARQHTYSATCGRA